MSIQYKGMSELQKSDVAVFEELQQSSFCGSKKSVDCRLYTPTIDDYQNCPSSTLKCFADEIKVLIEEWSTVGKIPCFTLNISLTTLASKFNQTESECRQCELFREEEAENFLKGLQLTLEMMNSQHCVRIRRTRRNYQN
ncbi:interleukin 15, like isoform X9 [Micropterus salmoides]|uniref:interleukin 15, like isoform X9 n=1 Tax=Micropterus salmoides TaxID=27706 RepID=UPI0018EB4ED4|nr:interleukin 15, like isoform X9 [Micropterus salmoides]